MNVALFYLADPRFGGWVTYTVHLAEVLKRRGHEVRLYKVGNRTERRARDYGSGWQYTNLSLLDAEMLVRSTPSFITAVGPKRAEQTAALLHEGARVVIHDPTELSPSLVSALRECDSAIVVIRPSNEAHLDKHGLTPVFIPHPYVRHAPKVQRTVHAVAYSRLDWDKHTLVIAQANAKLRVKERVLIHGAENRLYTHHKLDEAVPGWREEYRGALPATFDAAVTLAAHAHYAVDLSAISGDGDGTQYTFLEAWDAGAALVVNAKWIVTGKGSVNPLTAVVVSTPEDLVWVLQKKEVPTDTVRAGEAQLVKHGPDAVGHMYEELLA